MQPKETQSPAGTLAFAIAFLALSVLLLAFIGTETRFSSRGQLFAQPRTWPALGVGGMLLFSLALTATKLHSGFRGIGAELGTWLGSLEYLAWFMAYVLLVPIIGYLPATICFALLMAYRLGYRTPHTLILAAVMGAVIVLVFKAGLSVKIPGGAAYEYLPDAVRNFAIVNL